MLINESYVGDIVLVKDHNEDFTSLREITRYKVLSKEHYLAQRVRSAYIISVCQLKTFFDLLQATQTIGFSSKNISILNKRLL